MLGALVFLLIGLAGLVFGVKLVRGALAFRRTAAEVDGRYIGDVESRHPSGTDRVYNREVSFQCPFQKQKRRITAKTGSTRHSFQEVGDRVSVLVSSEPPHEARLNTFSELYLLPIVLLTLGVLALAASVGVVIRS